VKAWPRVAVGSWLAWGTGLGAFVAAVTWASWGPRAIAAGLGVFVVIVGVGLRRYWRRARMLRTPMDDASRKVLTERIAFYRDLPEAGRQRFEDDVRIFLAEQTIAGARGVEVDDETRLLIGASAAMLTHGWPDFEWPRVRDIVVYPRAFDEDYALGGNVAGMVHTQGPILLSRADLRRGFARPTDGHNVGLHELAHVLDLGSGAADGTPATAQWMVTLPWVEIIASRLLKVRAGDRRVLRAYAGTNEAELFAVAVEAFFERPRRLRDKDPELYRMLAEYFHQDPAD
jgi:hypothetical protein